MAERFTPDRITELGENEIFVFGSNLAGAHGGGAALLAYRKFGAIWGETIAPYVDEFIAFAEAHPELTFFVTKIGCGIAGFSEAEISPLFKAAHGIANIILPRGW